MSGDRHRTSPPVAWRVAGRGLRTAIVAGRMASRRPPTARVLAALALSAGLAGGGSLSTGASALASTVSERSTTVVFEHPGKGTLTIPANSAITLIWVVGARGGNGAGGEGSEGGRGGLGNYAVVGPLTPLDAFSLPTPAVEYEAIVGEPGEPGKEGGAAGGRPGGGEGSEGGGGGGGASMLRVAGSEWAFIGGGGGGGGSEPEGGGPSAGAGGGGQPAFEYSHSGVSNDFPALEGLKGTAGAVGGPHSEPGGAGFIENGGNGGSGSLENGGPGGDSTPTGSGDLATGGNGGKGSSDNGGGGGGGGYLEAGGGGGGGGLELTVQERGEEGKIGGGGGGAGGVSLESRTALADVFGGSAAGEPPKTSPHAIVEIVYVTKLGTSPSGSGSGSGSESSGSSPTAATGSAGAASPAGSGSLNVPLSCEAPAGQSCEMKLTLTASEQVKDGVVTTVKAPELPAWQGAAGRALSPFAYAAKAHRKAKSGARKHGRSGKHGKTIHRTVTLAEAVVVLVGTESETVPMHLNATGKSLLEKHPELKTSLKVAGPVDGTGKSVSTQAVTLRK